MENQVFCVLSYALGCKIILITMFEVWQFSEGFLVVLKRLYVPIYHQILKKEVLIS